MVETDAEKITEYKRYFHTGLRPVSFAQTLHRLLDFEYGEPIDFRTCGAGATQELVYGQDGLTIALEVSSVGITKKGLECKVGLLFISNNKKRIEDETSRKVWDHFNFDKSNLTSY